MYVFFFILINTHKSLKKPAEVNLIRFAEKLRLLQYEKKLINNQIFFNQNSFAKILNLY